MAHKLPKVQSGQTPGLARREFLVLGATGLLLPWLGRIVEAGPLAAPVFPVQVAPARPMSIGYVEGSDTTRSFRYLPWENPNVFSDSTPPEERLGFQVTPARDMPLGNQNMASTVARINVHGLYPADPLATQETLDSIDLEVYFPNPDPAVPTPLSFHAWSFRRRPARNAGQRLTFNIPIGIDGELRMSLVVGRRGATLRQRYDTNFTVDWTQGRPKLQRGIYLLGLSSTTWDSQVSLPAPGEKPRLDLRSVVVSVETSPKLVLRGRR
jgi:hypothetical protein